MLQPKPPLLLGLPHFAANGSPNPDRDLGLQTDAGSHHTGAPTGCWWGSCLGGDYILLWCFILLNFPVLFILMDTIASHTGSGAHCELHRCVQVEAPTYGARQSHPLIWGPAGFASDFPLVYRNVFERIRFALVFFPPSHSKNQFHGGRQKPCSVHHGLRHHCRDRTVVLFPSSPVHAVGDFNLNPCSVGLLPPPDTPLPHSNKGSFNPLLECGSVSRE